MRLHELALARAVANVMRLHGGDSILKIVTGMTYDVETSTMVTTVENFPVRTAVMEYTQKYSGMRTEESLIKTGDKQVFLMPTENLPTPEAGRDTLVLRGQNFSIVTVKEINPSGNKLYAYEMFVKQ